MHTQPPPPPASTVHTRRHPGSLMLLGGGGHSVVVAEAAWLQGAVIAGFLDDNPDATLGKLPIRTPHPFPNPPYIGGLADLSKLSGHEWIIALGDVGLRRRLLDALGASGHLAPRPGAIERACCVVHPSAQLAPSASVADGTFLGPLCLVHSRARVGPHAIVNSGAIVEHDCTIGENTHVAPGAVLGGGVSVGRDVLIGLGSRVLPGVRIGDRAVVGAGSVVVRDIGEGETVMGVPARGK